MALLKLTNAQRVRELMSEADKALNPSAHFTAVLDRLVLAVSAEVERYLGRKLNSEARTEVHSPRAWQRAIVLSAYPVATVTSVKQASDRDFAAATAMASTEYALQAEFGLLQFDEPLQGGPGTVQVVYTGGLVANEAADAHLTALEAAYPDLVLAATMWAKLLYDRRHLVGVASKSVKGTAVASLPGGTPPPEIKQLLDGYRRLRLG